MLSCILTKELSTKISVIIPAYNAEDTITVCLDSIYKTKYKDFEVIVVDDCSTDNTSLLLEKYPCKVIKLEKNSGVSIARNTGAKNAEGELLYFTDSDIVQRTDNLSRILEILKQNPSIAVVNVAHYWRSINRGFGPEFIGIKYYYDYDLLLRKNIHIVESSWFQALGGFISKKLFLECGGFNEKAPLGGEEYELGYRIRYLGHKICTFLDLEVYHFWWGLGDRLKLNYRRSQNWLPILLKRKTFETSGGVATTRNAANALLVTLTLTLSFISLFANTHYIPAILLITYFIYNLDFYRYVYKKNGALGFTFLGIFVDIVLYLSIGIGITMGVIKQIFNQKPY